MIEYHLILTYFGGVYFEDKYTLSYASMLYNRYVKNPKVYSVTILKYDPDRAPYWTIHAKTVRHEL